MKSLIEKIVFTCNTCQKVKSYHPCDGMLPPEDPELDPWHQVQVDLVLGNLILVLVTKLLSMHGVQLIPLLVSWNYQKSNIRVLHM